MKTSAIYKFQDVGGIRSITKSITWNLLILQIVSPLISDKFYTANSTALVISFDNFDVIPSNLAVAKSSIEVYRIDHPVTGNFIDLNSTKVFKEISWLRFDEPSRKIYISTTDDKDVGSYNIAVVQTFAGFSDANACS